ncbi:MAG: FhaA domain-containing protein [Anaerolineae bacterium]
MNQLARFESLIEQLVEGTFGRLFSGTLQPMEVAHALARALEDYQVTDEQGRRFAPNVFWVYLHPADYDALRLAQPSLPEDLARSVDELAERADLLMPERPVVEIVAADQIPRARVSVAAQYVAQETTPIGPTQEIAADEIRQAISNVQRIQSFLILDGKRHIPLNRPVMTLGRALDNDLVIDDTRVSRRHAQLRLRGGRYVLYDTGSSGGTAVNGEPMTEKMLQAGDVISLAGYAIVFGEDTPTSPEPLIALEDTPMMNDLDEH